MSFAPTALRGGRGSNADRTDWPDKLKIVLASTSAHKLREFQQLFAGTAIEIVPPERTVAVEEDQETFEGNAAKKAREWARAIAQPCLADDSGLAVDALGGRPGVHSARYADSDEARINRLLTELSGKADRSAAFHCAICVAWPDGRELCVTGRTPGVIAERPAGSGGFGYDPVFLLPERGLTYAQLSADQKNALSHRARAAQALLAVLPQALGREKP